MDLVIVDQEVVLIKATAVVLKVLEEDHGKEKIGKENNRKILAVMLIKMDMLSVGINLNVAQKMLLELHTHLLWEIEVTLEDSMLQISILENIKNKKNLPMYIKKKEKEEL